MLDAKMASALRKIISNSNFRRRVSVEEQKHDRFKRGRQIVQKSMTTLEQLELMMQLKAYQIGAIFAHLRMTFNISTQDGKYLKRFSLKVCTR